MKLTLDPQTLGPQIALLRDSLGNMRWTAKAIRPLRELNDTAFFEFIEVLYALSHESLCMHLRLNAPELAPLPPFGGYIALETELTGLTHQLLWCCDEALISEYRAVTLMEYETIRLLEQIHNQLIGAHYLQCSGHKII